MANVKIRPSYQNIDGIRVSKIPTDCFREVLNYKPKPDDVFIATYPKSGTTWMQSVALHIFRKGHEMADHEDFNTLCPYIDLYGLKGIEKMPRPGAFKTHLPYTRVPYSPESKYIYVLRNPKDCCVSMYYNTKFLQHEVYSEATFDDFFENFMVGEVSYNDYFDHLMSWYPHIKDEQVFFTTYETMKEDIRDVVIRLSSFLGKEYVDAIERDNAVLKNILHFSSFDYMKKNVSDAFLAQSNAIGVNVKADELQIIRKGIVGDWRNHFSDEQSERFNKKFVERTRGTEIFDMYKLCMGL